MMSLNFAMKVWKQGWQFVNDYYLIYVDIICLIGPPRFQSDTISLYLVIKIWKRVTIGEILKSHFISFRSILRWYKQLPSKVSCHNLSYQTTSTPSDTNLMQFSIKTIRKGWWWAEIYNRNQNAVKSSQCGINDWYRIYVDIFCLIGPPRQK